MATWVDAVLVSVPGFVTGLITARVTGQWGRFGTRVERIMDVASKLPETSAARARLVAHAETTAAQLANRFEQRTPLSLRFAVRTLVLAVTVLLLAVEVRVSDIDRIILNWTSGFAKGFSEGGPVAPQWVVTVLALLTLMLYVLLIYCAARVLMHVLYLAGRRWVFPHLPPKAQSMLRTLLGLWLHGSIRRQSTPQW